MLFNSVEYFLFLSIVCALFWAVPPKARPALLVLSSFVFYSFRDIRLAPLLLATVLLTYGAAFLIARANGRARLALLWATIVVQLATVGLFRAIAALSAVSATPLIPVGLSFYTFTSLSYVIDVYRRATEPERDLVLYGAYISFFPTLLAGPIVRSHRLLPQLRKDRRRIRPVQFNEGLELIFLGLFKKVAVANVLSEYVTSAQGVQPGSQSTVSLTSGLLTMVWLIVGGYFDLSGYVDMARGSAKLMGIELPRNFAQPLTRSANLTEFWRRWQITLMAWLRDYVFTPLRGSTRTNFRIGVAMTAVFLLVSLWHGAAFGWIMFGLTTSGLMVLERRFNQWMASRRKAGVAKKRRSRNHPVVVARRLAWVWFCLLFTQAWPVIGNSIGSAASSLSNAAPTVGFSVDPVSVLITVYAVVMLILLDNFERRQIKRETRPNPPTVRRSVVYGAMLIAIIVFSGTATRDFAYFGF